MEREAHKFNLQIGSEIPYFSLAATDGKIYSPADFRDKKALVIIFTCNHCPYAQAYEQRLSELAKSSQPLGAQFIAICSNDAATYPEDSFEQMIEKSKQLGFPFPYLHDETQIAAKAFDAACTPEVYIFDAEQKLRYHGRIDDNYRNPAEVKQFDLKDALNAVLSGEAPTHPLTPAIGCSIKWKT